MDDEYILSELVDLTELVSSCLSSKIKFVAFDVSQRFIIFGANSSSLYVFKRYPSFELERIVPSQKFGSIAKVAISPKETVVAFSNGNGKIGFLDLQSNTQHVIQIQLPNETSVSCFCWSSENDKQLHVGDNGGNVSVCNLSYYMGRNILNVNLYPILLLENPIYQISGYNDYLLVSTLTKCVICNIDKEEFKQIGNRPRDGQFGGNFIVDYNAMELHQQQTLINSIEDYEKMLLANVKIFCCRPGLRLWQVDLMGNVNSTHQFKGSLSSIPQSFSKDLNSIAANDKQQQFATIHILHNAFLFIFNTSGFYIIDPARSNILFWTQSFDKSILDAKLINNCIYMHLKDGKFVQVNFYKLQQFTQHLVERDQFGECGQFLKSNFKYFQCLLKRGEQNDLNILKSLLKFKDRFDCSYSEIRELFEDIENKKIQTVTILRNNDKVIQIDEMSDLNQEFSEDLTQDNSESESSGKDAIPSVLPTKLTILSITEPEESIANIDRAVKQLFLILKSSQISNRNFSHRYAKVFDEFHSSTIIRILVSLEQFLVENDELDQKSSNMTCIKMYFDYLRPELIWELNDSSREFIKNGLITINNDCIKELVGCCHCNFSLNVFDSNTCQYIEIGNVLQQFYWSRKEYDKGLSLATQVPALLKIIGKFHIDERNYSKMIQFVTFLADSELLKKALIQFNDSDLFNELIQEFKLIIVDKQFKCLQCQELNRIKNNPHQFYSWNELFLAISECLEGPELLTLLTKYSDVIPNGAISKQFYLQLLLNATMQ